jgi:gluconolactonase
VLDRRHLLRTAAAGAVGAAFATSAGAQPMAPNPNLPDPPGTTPPPRHWNEFPLEVYPDPAFEIFDKRFEKYSAGTAPLYRVWSGARWMEGPVYFADQHVVIFSDIPNNRMMRYDEVSGETTVFRQPSNNANGNTRDRQGRLITCEHRARRVTRTEYTGEITVLADNYQGKRLNSPNGVIVKSDNTIWFTDPSYGIMGNNEGLRQHEELPRNVYMLDPRSGKLSVAAGDFTQPNGIAFSPDEKLLYITDTGSNPGVIRVFECTEDNRLVNGRLFHEYKNGGISDDIRVDEDGNIWSAGGWSKDPNYNGVSVYAPDGTPWGRIVLPETAGNLCFGGYGHNHSYLYIAAGGSLYVMPVGTRAAPLSRIAG